MQIQSHPPNHVPLQKVCVFMLVMLLGLTQVAKELHPQRGKDEKEEHEE